jgi:hypothetical protein
MMPAAQHRSGQQRSIVAVSSAAPGGSAAAAVARIWLDASARQLGGCATCARARNAARRQAPPAQATRNTQRAARTGVALKAVHLRQQLVERLLALVVAAANACARACGRGVCVCVCVCVCV